MLLVEAVRSSSSNKESHSVFTMKGTCTIKPDTRQYQRVRAKYKSGIGSSCDDVLPWQAVAVRVPSRRGSEKKLLLHGHHRPGPAALR